MRLVLVCVLLVVGCSQAQFHEQPLSVRTPVREYGGINTVDREAGRNLSPRTLVADDGWVCAASDYSMDFSHLSYIAVQYARLGDPFECNWRPAKTAESVGGTK